MAQLKSTEKFMQKSETIAGVHLDVSPPKLPLRVACSFAAALLIIAMPFLSVPDFLITQLNYIGIDAIAVLGIVLLTGVVGLTSFGQAAFAGVGAYATAYLCLKAGLSPWSSLLVGLVLTGVVASIVGAVTLRMSGHNLALATIAWCIALYVVMGNMEALGKHDGLSNLPQVSVFGKPLRSSREFYLLIWVSVILTAFGIHRLLMSRTGRILRSLNPDRGGGETMPGSMGASAFRYKLLAFVIAALLASLSGWLLAHMQRTVNPSPFGITRSMEFVFMAVLGGVGHIWGAVVGAGISTFLKDSLQTLIPSLTGLHANIEGLVFGALLVVILKVSPKGLWQLVEDRLPRNVPKRNWSTVELLQTKAKPVRGTTLLQLIGLHKNFGGLAAVQDISFSIKAGEIVGLIGPNGAGKSTTFNLISGVLPLSSGSVTLDGKRVDGMSAREIANHGLSRTFQHVKLVPDMSVLENVAIGCYSRTRAGLLQTLTGFDRREERQAMKEAELQLRRVGLQDSMLQPAGDLPLGSQRLVEIARALAADPALLLLDEPAAGLRHGEKQALAQVLGQLRGEGLSLLLVEHDMEFVMNLADRVVVMEFGRKLIEDEPAQVQASPLVRAAYLGTEH
jgi:branched-chain amino acid transport system permease protein